MFLEFDFWGVPSLKNTPILTFDFPLPGPEGTHGALGVCQIKKLHNTKSNRHLILVGVPFIKNIVSPKFWSQPLASPAFRPRFLGRQAENQNSAPNILLALLSLFRKGVTTPLPQDPGRRLIWQKLPFLGSGPDPRAPGSRAPAQNLLSKS